MARAVYPRVIRGEVRRGGKRGGELGQSRGESGELNGRVGYLRGVGGRGSVDEHEVEGGARTLGLAGRANKGEARRGENNSCILIQPRHTTSSVDRTLTQAAAHIHAAVIAVLMDLGLDAKLTARFAPRSHSIRSSNSPPSLVLRSKA
jgi:hypothetical protein